MRCFKDLVFDVKTAKKQLNALQGRLV